MATCHSYVAAISNNAETFPSLQKILSYSTELEMIWLWYPGNGISYIGTTRLNNKQTSMFQFSWVFFLHLCSHVGFPSCQATFLYELKIQIFHPVTLPWAKFLESCFQLLEKEKKKVERLHWLLNHFNLKGIKLTFLHNLLVRTSHMAHLDARLSKSKSMLWKEKPWRNFHRYFLNRWETTK